MKFQIMGYNPKIKFIYFIKNNKLPLIRQHFLILFNKLQQLFHIF